MPEQFKIKGSITQPGGNYYTLLSVRAFDIGFRCEKILGETNPNTDNYYEILYTADKLCHDRKNAHIIVRVFNLSGIKLGESEIICNASEEVQVPLITVQLDNEVPSEYEILLSKLNPILKDISMADLTDEDIAFLTCDLGIDRQRLEFLRQSTQLAQQTNLPIEVFYGSARNGISLDLAKLINLPDEEIRKDLEDAINKAFIPFKLQERLDEIIRRLKMLNYVSHQVVGQLLDKETGMLLINYSVHGFDLDAGIEPEDLGSYTTYNDGQFVLVYTSPPDISQDDAYRRLLLKILNPEMKEIFQQEVQVKIDQTEILKVQVPVPLQEVPISPAIRELVTTLQLDIPEELMSYLDERNINGLADIRKAGGISQLQDLPLAADHPAVKTLEAHADLSRLSMDIRLNASLIEKGFMNVSTIAESPRSDFVSVAHEAIGDFKSAQMHVMARAQTDFLNNVLAEKVANQANGNPSTIMAEQENFFQERCECKDCEAAVSPAAYLADLLDYTLKHVKSENKKIDNQFLKDTFHQPFGDLPIYCEAVEQQVRQVRICIETLRSYLGKRPLTDTVKEGDLAKAEKVYLLDAYTRLLSKIGISYEEIRLAHTAKQEERIALAERLGIGLTVPRPDPKTTPGDELDQLFLNQDVNPPDPHELTEQSLERLFGLVDTTSDPLSDGIKFGDDSINPQITQWNLDYAVLGRDTDEEGMVYLKLLPQINNLARIEIYKDVDRTELVAFGDQPAAGEYIKVFPVNSSGLSGTFNVKFTAASNLIEIAVIPKFLSWRLKSLRDLWEKQDRPDDVYTEGQSSAELKALPSGLVFPAELEGRIFYDASNQRLIFNGIMQESEKNILLTLPGATDEPYRTAVTSLFVDSQRPPIIDPDIIGPDDFRMPVEAASGNPIKAFDLWLKRRNWVDDQLNKMASLTRLENDLSVPDITAILNSMYQPVDYNTASVIPWANTTQLTDFEKLNDNLAHGVDIEATVFRIKSELNLTVDSFVRLMIILSKAQLVQGARNEPVTDDEWRELYTILVQAQKVKLFSVWLAEEKELAKQLGLENLLGLEEFWFSLSEPNIGDWPPVTIGDRPPIDPELFRLNELPEPTAGKDAIEFWHRHKGRLEQIPKDLQAKREAQTDDVKGFDDMLRFAIGHPNSGDPLQHDLNNLKDNLSSPDETIRNNAIKQIKDDLHLTIGGFKRLMEIKAKNDSTDLSKKPTSAEYAEVYTLLTPARKLKHEYPAWLQEEQSPTRLSYWRALKAKLPRWRATADARQAWHQALYLRSQPPVIDPDLIVKEDLQDQKAGVAYTTWKTRQDWLETLKSSLDNVRNSKPRAIDSFDAIVTTALGVKGEDLKQIDSDSKNGNSIEGRLKQLNISNTSFSYLLQIRDLAEREMPILDNEWEGTYSILIQAQKSRKFAEWRDEERIQQITLSPDYFKISKPSEFELPIPEPKKLDPWRATWVARRDWQDTLQSRIDQENAVIAGLHEAISATEEIALPYLRDALVVATAETGSDLESKAKWTTERFLIDAGADGCLKTTRVEQAIETLQGILFAIRSGQPEALNNLLLTLEAEHFDEEWKWIGSYATWRSAMFVFLYPENILHPSLHRPQTPVFKELVDYMRQNTGITPKDACERAKIYSDYFRDICSMSIEATCQTITPIYRGDACSTSQADERPLFYMFGLAPSGKAYWSRYDPLDKSGYAQTVWEEVRGLNFEKVQVLRIIGAIPVDSRPYFQRIRIIGEISVDPLLKNIQLLQETQSSEIDTPVNEIDTPIKRFIYLFAIIREGDSQQLVFIKFNLLTSKWDDIVTAVRDSLPNADDLQNLTIVPVQTADDTTLPKLALLSGFEVYVRGVLEDGHWIQPSQSWDSFTYTEVGRIEPSEEGYLYNAPEATGILQLHAVIDAGIEANSQLWFCFTNRSRNLIIHTEGYKAWNLKKSKFLGALPSSKKLIGETVGTVSSRIHVFYRDEIKSLNSRFGMLFRVVQMLLGTKNAAWNSPVNATMITGIPQTIYSDITNVLVHSGSSFDPNTMFTYKRRQKLFQHEHTIFSYSRYVENDDQIIRSLTGLPLPLVDSPLNIPERLNSTALQVRRQLIKKVFEANENSNQRVSPFILTFLQEAFYFVPLHLAMQLQTAGHYVEALDWFRTIYDYQAHINERKIYYGLEIDVLSDPEYKRVADWLLDPLNPHLIASMRQYTYTHFTLMSLVRCLMDFADNEFTLDTVESLAKARALYMAALELLDLPEIKQQLGACKKKIFDLVIEFSEIVPPENREAMKEIGESLFIIPYPKTLADVFIKVKNALTADKDWNTRLSDARSLIQEAIIKTSDRQTISSILENKSEFVKKAYENLLTQPSIDQAAQVSGSLAAEDFLNGVSFASDINKSVLEKENVSLPWLRLTSLTESDPVSVSELTYASPIAPEQNLEMATQVAVNPISLPNIEFCIPPNPILKALRLHAELSLYKLRTCRNITGIKRELELYAAPTDTVTGLPTIGAGGQLILPNVTTVLRPTLYPYSVLIERAKQLVQIAAQIEAQMLLTLEKRDAEHYNLLRARQELDLANASVKLQDLKVIEANGQVKFAQLQQDRAQIQEEYYKKLLEKPIADSEHEALIALNEAIQAQMYASEASWMSTKSISTTGYSLGVGVSLTSNVGLNLGESVGTSLSETYSINYKDMDAVQAAYQASLATWNSMNSQMKTMVANFERRTQEWQFQQSLANQDIAIGAQQVQIANDHVQVATQERTIAGIQDDNAKDIVEFLTNKFTSEELYDWMSGILERIYRYFLQQATSMAKLAENQLAFERQEVPPAFIMVDYWQMPTGYLESDKDRRGLTGSARLLQDIYQLDQYAFLRNNRKLQLTKTISLERQAPAEFQQFRKTGVMTFATPMEMFDRDFPGHYLRLIKRVRTSVIALTPPTEGIHATLSTAGLSRVVIGPDVFQTVNIRRDPESVALSAPMNSTGLFELEQQSDMLIPFEGSGVDTIWEFNMPKAANLFDYRSIADVLITIEYTALNSFDYHQQVIKNLNSKFSANRSFSFCQQADLWYDLHNPYQTNTPMTVRFRTIREDFPPNLDKLNIKQIILYFARANEKSFEISVKYLHFTEQGSSGNVGGGATSIDGAISTLRGNAGSWISMIGKSPIGEWELALPNTEEMKERFKKEEIEDILFVITYSGRTPEWPA